MVEVFNFLFVQLSQPCVQCGQVTLYSFSFLLKGRRTKDEDTGYIIHKLAKFLEVCLDEWLHYINEKRNTYLHLNYFTIDQLVLLQRELVKIGTEDEPSLMIYPLLSAVKKDCTPADLNEAIQQAQHQLDQVDLLFDLLKLNFQFKKALH